MPAPKVKEDEMSDDNKDDELTSLKARISELEAKVSPPKSDFVPLSDAEWRDRMHALAERRMAMATPPSVVREFAVLDDRLVKEIALRDARAPTGRPGMIPTDGSVGGRPSSGDGSGWAKEIPIDVPGGTRTQELIERQVNAALPHGPEWGKGKKG
jgi:hypothetical protein